MELIFRAKDFTLTDRLRDHVEEKLKRVTRYLPESGRTLADVDIRREAKGSGGGFIVEVTIEINGVFLRAEERAGSIEDGVNAAAAALSRQATRYKGKRISKRRANREPGVAVAPEETRTAPSVKEEVISDRVVRRKEFNVKPMSEAEAVEQMELLGHSFFLFRDEDRQQLALLYRRRDGDYGLIMPESP